MANSTPEHSTAQAPPPMAGDRSGMKVNEHHPHPAIAFKTSWFSKDFHPVLSTRADLPRSRPRPPRGSQAKPKSSKRDLMCSSCRRRPVVFTGRSRRGSMRWGGNNVGTLMFHPSARVIPGAKRSPRIYELTASVFETTPGMTTARSDRNKRHVRTSDQDSRSFRSENRAWTVPASCSRPALFDESRRLREVSM